MIHRLNDAVHGLGATLMKLDPVAVYHQSVAKDEGLASDSMGSVSRARALVADMTGGASRGMVGWLRDRVTGDDYLLVVNKDLAAARAFTVRLTPAVRGLQRVLDGAAQAAAIDTTARSFTTPALDPGSGALYHVVR